MSKPMSKSDSNLTAAEYVLGLTRGAERRSVEERIAADPELKAQVARWETRFAPLDFAGAEVPPPAVLDDALMQIDAEGAELPGTVTRRAEGADWQPLSPGVTFRVLRDDHDLKRRSMLLRMEPGAIYLAHQHDGGDEECLVIEGDLTFGDVTLRAGDFHVAVRGVPHPPSRSVGGCLLHITTALQ